MRRVAVFSSSQLATFLIIFATKLSSSKVDEREFSNFHNFCRIKLIFHIHTRHISLIKSKRNDLIAYDGETKEDEKRREMRKEEKFVLNYENDDKNSFLSLSFDVISVQLTVDDKIHVLSLNT